MASLPMQSTSQLSLACPKCGAENHRDAKYCGNCGHGLWRPCPECKQSNRIEQAYCDHCGFHLAGEIQRRIDTATQMLQRAEELFSSHDYDQSGTMASRLASAEDRHLAPVALKASELLKRAQQEKAAWETKLAAVRENAQEATNRKDHRGVVEILQDIPPILLGDELRALLNRSTKHLQEHRQLRQKLQAAIASQDFVQCGSFLDDLLVLEPESDEYQGLARKVASRLCKIAQEKFTGGAYAESLAYLSAIPRFASDSPEIAKLRTTILDATWLTDQIAHTTIATPTLGRLVQRFSQLAPHEERVKKLLPQLAQRVKSKPQDSYSLFPGWVGAVKWQETPVVIFRGPQNLDLSATVAKENPTRYSIALGLALQGLGQGEVSEALHLTEVRTGLKSLLKRRAEVSAAWGIDAGSSMIRAVRVVRSESGLTVDKAIAIPLDPPLCRSTVELRATVFLREKLEVLAPLLKEHEGPVWINFPSRDCLGKFLKLPPVAEKQLDALVNKELASQFPIALDQLNLVKKIVTKTADGSPRCHLVAAKKSSVEQRLKLFQEAGIFVSGVQADPIALHHFVRYELGELTPSSDVANATPDSLIFIESGAAGTLLYCATPEAFWFRIVDFGGEELTSRLAGGLKISLERAEAIKREPWTSESLSESMELLESVMNQQGRRMVTYLHGAKEFLGDIRLQRILCAGGNVLTHGWTRHTFSG